MACITWQIALSIVFLEHLLINIDCIINEPIDKNENLVVVVLYHVHILAEL